MELYNDILKAIVEEITNDDDIPAKDTRVQLRSNLAYDKLAKYLAELESKKNDTTKSTFNNRKRQRLSTRL